MTDFHITADTWTPIGAKITDDQHEDPIGFEGIFDGNGHVISGKLNVTDYIAGFFAIITGNTTIKNLHISADVSGTFEAGGLVGQGSSDNNGRKSLCRRFIRDFRWQCYLNKGLF